MKTTIELPDTLLRRAKEAAIERGTSLKVVVEEALSKALGPASSPGVPIQTVTWPRGGIASGKVDAEAVLREIRRDRDRDPLTTPQIPLPSAARPLARPRQAPAHRK